MSSALERLIELSLEEDIGSGDITTDAIVPPGLMGVAKIEANEDLILSGARVAERVFSKLDPSLVWETDCEDGDLIEEEGTIATISGSVASILKAERTALNFLQHLSGIATFTNLFVKSVKGTNIKILDTRKTTPGMRELEKEAVKAGDGENHRMGLYDRYLIKSTHITVAGSVEEAIRRVKAKRKQGVLIEVEVRDLGELEEAVSAGVDIVMLDNFTPSLVDEAVKRVRGRAKIEVSGNITLENITDYIRDGVDYISIGTITHSAPAADIHLVLV